MSRLKATLAVSLLAACGFVVLALGCRAVISQDSIYADADQPPDPAVTDPYVGVGSPGMAESVVQQPPPATQTALPRLPTERTWQSVDVSDEPQVRVWIDDRPARQPIDGKTFRVEGTVSQQPTLRFEIDPRLGRFRGATIELYRQKEQKIDRDSGVRLSEDGQPAALLPGRDISLCNPPKGVTRQRIAGGEPAKPDELAEDSEYEVLVSAGGSAMSDAVAVRFRTATATATTRPADPAPPLDRVDPSRLPPGVEIPKE